MDNPLLVLARDNLRTTMVLLGLVVIILASLVRKKKRMDHRRRADAEIAEFNASFDRMQSPQRPR